MKLNFNNPSNAKLIENFKPSTRLIINNTSDLIKYKNKLELDLGKNSSIIFKKINFTIDDAKVLAKCIELDNELSDCELHSCNFESGAFELIISAINSSKNIDQLNFTNNSIKAENMRDFYQTLKDNSKIRSIGIINCKIKDEGAKYIACLMLSNMPLVTLAASACDISLIGANKIFAALKYNVRLMSLSLNNNDFSGQISTPIKEFLESNFTLNSLQLNNCKLNEQFVKDLLIELNNNLIITDLQIDDKCDDEKEEYRLIDSREKSIKNFMQGNSNIQNFHAATELVNAYLKQSSNYFLKEYFEKTIINLCPNPKFKYIVIKSLEKFFSDTSDLYAVELLTHKKALKEEYFKHFMLINEVFNNDLIFNNSKKDNDCDALDISSNPNQDSNDNSESFQYFLLPRDLKYIILDYVIAGFGVDHSGRTSDYNLLEQLLIANEAPAVDDFEANF